MTETTEKYPGRVIVEGGPVVRAFRQHIARERAILKLVALALVLIVVAMGVGSWLIYKNATNPARIFTTVDKEFAHLEQVQQQAAAKTARDVCSFLHSNHLKASAAVQRDLHCVIPKPGTKSQPSSSTANTAQTPGAGSSTTIVQRLCSDRPRQPLVRPREDGPRASTSPSATATPTPTQCLVVSVLGRCRL